MAKAGAYTSRKDIPHYELPNSPNEGSSLFKLVNRQNKNSKNEDEKNKVIENPHH